MDHKQAAITILGAVGGVKNIISAQHCATRLRLVLRTAELANDNAIRAVPGVLDVVRADGQYQIVIGPDVVNVFSALLALPGFDAVAACDAETDAPDFSPSDTQEKRKVPLWRSAQRAFISTLAAIIVPVVPALTAAGSLRALLMLLNALGLTAAWRPYYQVLFGLCNLPFRFLPILFAYTAARRFHAEMGVSFMAACALVTPGLADAYMLGLPHGSTASKMISSVGSPQNILPVIVVVWFISVVGRQDRGGAAASPGLLQKLIPQRSGCFFQRKPFRFRERTGVSPATDTGDLPFFANSLYKRLIPVRHRSAKPVVKMRRRDLHVIRFSPCGKEMQQAHGVQSSGHRRQNRQRNSIQKAFRFRQISSLLRHNGYPA